MVTAVERAIGHRRGGAALALGLGVIAAAGQAPLSWAWLSLATWALALGLLTLPSDWRRAAVLGWAFGTGHFAAALHWIVEPFLVDVARHGWMAPFALVLMASGLALFWGGAFALAARLGGGNRRRRVLLAVVALSAAEMLRAVVFTGFPWASIGHVWIGWPQMQLASLVGAPGLTLMTLAAAALPALFGARRAALGAIVAAAAVSLPGAWAAWRVPPGPAPVTGLTVRLVQPNAEQHLKWHPDHVLRFFERQVDFTAAPAPDGGPRPELVIWPEISVPYAFDSAGPALAQVAEAADGAEVAVGLQRRDDRGRWFNMLARIDGRGVVTATYDKHHLVPFGEYMPLADLFSRWGVFGLAANAGSGFSSGDGPGLMDFGVAGKALPLICYEAIFPRHLARVDGRADWLLHATNDAWFGALSGPYQHLAQARLRAVEQGLPLMRAANTGVSAGFDPYGRELARLPLGTAGFVDLDLPEPLPPTPYVLLGDGPVAAFLAALACLAPLVFRRRDIDAGQRPS